MILLAVALGVALAILGLLGWQLRRARRDQVELSGCLVVLEDSLTNLQLEADLRTSERDEARGRVAETRIELAALTERVAATAAQVTRLETQERDRIEAVRLADIEATYLDGLSRAQAVQKAEDTAVYRWFVEETMARIWRDIGLNPETFSPSVDLATTGKTNDILLFTALALDGAVPVRHPIRTVGDAVDLFVGHS